MDTKNDVICLNCKYLLNDQDHFCSSCRQRTKLGRLTIREIVSKFLSSVFNIDAPFPKTLSRMFFNPHLIVKEFINGRRKSYYAPVKYMVLCLFINILFGEIIGFDPIDNQRAMDSGTMDEQSIIGYKAGEFLSKYLNYFLFILPFSIAVISKLFFWKSPYNFAERTAMGFYIAGQFILISIIPISLSKLDPLLMYSMYPISIAYITYALYKFFEMKSKFSRLIFSFFAAFFSFFGYILVAFLIAFFIVIQFNL